MKKLFLILFLIAFVSGFTQETMFKYNPLTSRMDMIRASVTISGSATDSLLIDSDGDTKVEVERATDDDIIRFMAGGVDIGTMTSLRLNIAGKISSTGAVYADAGHLFMQSNKIGSYSSSPFQLGNFSTGATALYSANSEIMRLLSNGNVGIGTTTPSQKLEVNGKILSSGSRSCAINPDIGAFSITGNASGWQTGYQLFGSSGTLLSQFGALGSSNTLTYSFVGADYTNPEMVWRGGNVGIGTATPTALFEIKGNTPTMKYVVSRGGNGEAAFEIIDAAIDNINGSNDWIKIGVRGYLSGTQAMNYLYVGDTYLDNALRVYPNKDIYLHGNVGIGTIIPTEKLEVNGNVKTDAIIYNHSVTKDSLITISSTEILSGYSSPKTIIQCKTDEVIFINNFALKLNYITPYTVTDVVGVEFITGTSNTIIADGYHLNDLLSATTSKVLFGVSDNFTMMDLGEDIKFKITNANPTGGSSTLSLNVNFTRKSF